MCSFFCQTSNVRLMAQRIKSHSAKDAVRQDELKSLPFKQTRPTLSMVSVLHESFPTLPQKLTVSPSSRPRQTLRHKQVARSFHRADLRNNSSSSREQNSAEERPLPKRRQDNALPTGVPTKGVQARPGPARSGFRAAPGKAGPAGRRAGPRIVTARPGIT